MAIQVKANAPDPILLAEAGVIPRFVRFKKFGRAPSASSGVWTTIWDGNVDYPYPSGNLTAPTIVSTNAGDNQNIVIQAVDENFKYKTQTITLNGLTPVNLDIDIMQPFRMENIGSTSLAGSVTLVASATTYAQILNGANEYNQTQMAIMVVPKGYYGLVTKVGSSMAENQSAEINYRAKPFGEPWKVRRPLDIKAEVYVEEVNFFFNEKTILDVRIKPQSANTAVSAWFDILLVEKDRFHQLWGLPNRTELL